MTIDKAKLKALAGAANAVTTDVNITMAVGAAPEEVKAVQDYLQAAMPNSILTLLAEIERLEMDNRSLKGSCSKLGAEHAGMSRLYKKANRMQFEARQERDQLKAEIEALRKDAERYLAIRDEIPHAELGRAIMDVQSACEYDEAIDAAMEKEASHG